MLKSLLTMYWKWRVGRFRNQLERQLRNSSEVVEIQVGALTLTSFNPGKKRTGLVNDREVIFNFSTWDGEAFFPFWGDKLQLCLSAGSSRPSQHQLDVVQALLTYPEFIRPDVETAIFDFYRTRVYHEGANDLRGNPLPKPTEHQWIRKIIHGPAVLIDSRCEEGNSVCFKLHFGCDWDEEHGMGVNIEDWRITEIEI